MGQRRSYNGYKGLSRIQNMMATTRDFEEDYLNYLCETVQYGDKAKPRVRKPHKWRQLCEKLRSHEILVYGSSNDDHRKTWVISDQHFGHKNIIKYSDRPYSDVLDMTEKMIESHNSVVRDCDKVIVVGDFAFLRDDIANEILRRLNGHKMLIVGNHDLDRDYNIKKLNFDNKIFSGYINYRGVEFVLTHYPYPVKQENVFNIHGHVHNNDHEFVDSMWHFNVSCEVINYTPVDLDYLVEQAKTRITSSEA